MGYRSATAVNPGYPPCHQRMQATELHHPRCLKIQVGFRLPGPSAYDGIKSDYAVRANLLISSWNICAKSCFHDPVDLQVGIPEFAEHAVRVLTEAGRRQTEAVAGCGRKQDRYGGRQHRPLGGMLDPSEKPGLGEIGVGEQAWEVCNEPGGDGKSI